MSTQIHCEKCGGEPVGVIVRGVYDGVLFWKCLACGWAWERGTFSGDRARVAADAIATANRAWSVPSAG